jgi:ComF family protein
LVSKPFVPTTRDLPESFPRRIADAFLNLVFPESCLICAQPVSRQQDCSVCTVCWEKVLQLRIREPWCASCGLPFQNYESDRAHLCSECILSPPPYAGARAFGYYTAELSRIVQGLKFNGRQNLAGLLSPLMTTVFFECWSRSEFDLVVPVPLHPKRRRERGFNQAALLARGIARQIAVPFAENVLARTRNTSPQVGLTDANRMRNVRGAFRCFKSEEVDSRRVLLIDDVMTTGATAASAADALMAAGAHRVSVLTAARAVPGL